MASTLSKTSLVTELLEREIRSGKYKPGDRLPSMRELAQLFGVSTMVLHQASRRLAEKGLLLRGARSGLFIPPENKPCELCAFISSVHPGYQGNYYDAFMSACAGAGAVAMVTSCRLDNLEAMLEKKPLRVYVDVGSKDISYNELARLTRGFETICCNRFEFAGETPGSGVLSDWVYITEMTLRRFLEAGHRRILFVSHNPVMLEYKRLEMCEAARRVGLTFDSPEFQWCSYRDFQDNPARVVRMFRGDPPTAAFARGDVPLREFSEKAALFFPDAPPLDKIGAFDSIYSNLPGQEFPSWHWDWNALWKQVFSHKEKCIEYYRPVLHVKTKQEEDRK